MLGRLKSIIPGLRNWDLPILVQEMRMELRGGRAHLIMGGYVLGLSAVLLIALTIVLHIQSQMQGVGFYNQTAVVGRMLFLTMSIAQFCMITLVIPAYSGAAVSREREKKTFVLMALTLLKSSSIVSQKITASALAALLLIVTSLPVLAIVFWLGGVSPLEVAFVYLILIASTALLSALGVLCSCLLENVRTSTFATYVAAVVIMVGLPVSLRWAQDVSRIGASSALANSPVAFLLIFAFVSGTFALLFYGIVSMLLMRCTTHWLSRTFRMAVFGGCYVLFLLLFNLLGVLQPLFPGNSSAPFAMYINPLYAIIELIQSPYRTFTGVSQTSTTLAVIGSTAFTLGLAYVCQRLAVLRLDALRTS